MRNTGKIRSWNEQKGFGFIRSSAGGKELFLHISALRNRSRVPRIGQTVTYTLATDKQGRPCAAQALLPGDRISSSHANRGTIGAIFVAVAFLCLVASLVFAKLLPILILLGYLAVSLVTFLAYASDKNAAKKGTWRTSEGTLHWLSLAGGWPGALIAQQALRHKFRKQSFRAVFWATVIINCAALIWICTPNGSQLLQEKAGAVFGNKSSATIEWAE
jgi:uncharacterized membrane protein YsdA (DUF1294 family)/cold shock CspA family protein